MTFLREAKRIYLSGVSRIVEDTWNQAREPIPERWYGPDDLVEYLKNGWVLYFECHKCRWFETCPYPQRYPENPHRARDIQCEIVLIAMRNFVRAWWPRLAKMTRAQRQNFLDALFHFTEYMSNSHMGNATLVNNLDISWWGPQMAIGISTSPLYLRPTLDKFAEAMKKLPSRSVSEQQFVFVEGESEEAFVRRLCELRFFSSTLSVHSLGGKANAQPSRLPLKLLTRKGYTVSVQVDGDCARRAWFGELSKAVNAAGGSVFIFRRDFESAFPVPFLIAALKELGIALDQKWLVLRHRRKASGPLLKQIEQKARVQIPKVEFARILAAFVPDNWPELMQKYRRNEITRWLYSIRIGGKRRASHTKQVAPSKSKTATTVPRS